MPGPYCGGTAASLTQMIVNGSLGATRGPGGTLYASANRKWHLQPQTNHLQMLAQYLESVHFVY
ncbi:unnamed protein product, partial [Didymodactylos carnosus]